MTVKSLVSGGLLIGFLGCSCVSAGNREIELITEDLPWAAVDMEYSPGPLEARVSGRCPASAVGFNVASGALPSGLRLSPAGSLSGVPNKTGLFYFTVRAMNGCSWTARRFSLLVTNPPKLRTVPDQLSSESAGADVQMILHLMGTWPQLPYAVHTSYGEGASDWLDVAPIHGLTSKESEPRRLTEVPQDDITVVFHVSGLKAGCYRAEIAITAWQARAVMVPVTLTVK